MQVTETLAEGLKRELKVVVPAKDMASQLNEKLAEAKGKMRINGFRPGKVPISHLKKVYGEGSRRNPQRRRRFRIHHGL